MHSLALVVVRIAFLCSLQVLKLQKGKCYSLKSNKGEFLSTSKKLHLGYNFSIIIKTCLVPGNRSQS